MRARLAMLSLLFLCACGSAPPDGFTLEIRLTAIDPAVVSEMDLSFRPGTGAGFQALEMDPMSYEDGAITLHVETDGTLTMKILGDHVRAHSTPLTGGGVGAVYDLEIWSDDMTANMEPRLVGTVLRDTELIGMGSGFLSEWPPGEGHSGQLAIQCTPTAAAGGRCRP